MTGLRATGGLSWFGRWLGVGAAAVTVVVAGFVTVSTTASASTGGVLADATISPVTVVGGTPAQGTVTLVSAVDADTVVVLSSTDATVLRPPAAVTVPAGATSAVFPVTTFVFSGPGEFACVNATAGGVTRTPCLNSNPSPSGPVATSVTFSAPSVGGGSPVTGTVGLSAAADGNTSLVTLVSSDPAVLSVPARVVATAGSATTAFPVTTASVASTRSVTVTATVDGGSAAGSLTITPATTPPTTDTVRITRAEWKSGILRIEATSSDPDAILEVHLASTDTFMFGLTNVGGGRYQAQHEWLDNPQRITVRSNLGGSATATT
ncbi:hypothetical protein GA0115240_10335 [Streptomyces sp. DvalAA-14]|uniref:hypothetical protein n=1 Tax=unclassified Streptomyces TaxID=2593676 RepID=UPI00081B03FE|nr:MULTISPECIES: hypothetical protein [unclassified Streptomyces]MYS19035.1 hypothetical protein [Streptomyces sp. SID4948]SCD34689.1 hypothetical protein GA0115240_10335 [Streptomyces sp. DvalAA-14]